MARNAGVTGTRWANHCQSNYHGDIAMALMDYLFVAPHKRDHNLDAFKKFFLLEEFLQQYQAWEAQVPIAPLMAPTVAPAGQAAIPVPPWGTGPCMPAGSVAAAAGPTAHGPVAAATGLFAQGPAASPAANPAAGSAAAAGPSASSGTPAGPSAAAPIARWHCHLICPWPFGRPCCCWPWTGGRCCPIQRPSVMGLRAAPAAGPGHGCAKPIRH